MTSTGARIVLSATLMTAILQVGPAAACDQTVGVFVNEPQAHVGYTLFSQLSSSTTYLIDNDGLLINSWETLAPGFSCYLLENGHLLQNGGNGGWVEEYDWDGNLVWSFQYSSSEHQAHHDIAPLPNGNVLILAREFLSEAQAIAAGRDPALLSEGELWSEHVVEIEPLGASGGNIVWQWRLWDHLIQDFDPAQDNCGVVAEHPELVDINFTANAAADWIHANAIDYNAEFDQIMVNSPRFAEFWIIDHSTTTAQAAGSTGGNSGVGGDLLYRWGNPQTYGAGNAGDQKLFGQHDAHWIAAGLAGAGNILVFNNGNGRPEGPFSSIEELMLPVDVDGLYDLTLGSNYEPQNALWTYAADPPTNFYSNFISGAQRLPNGNTLICSGAWGTIFEVAP